MKKIFIFLITMLSMPCLHAMDEHGPIAYPLDLTTTLTTDSTTLFRQEVEHTLINNTVKLRTWGSPQQKTQCWTQTGPAHVIETELKYDIRAEILNAKTHTNHHDVYVAVEVKQLLLSRLVPLHKELTSVTSQISLYKKDGVHFVVPKGNGAILKENLPTFLGVLNFNVAVSSFPVTDSVIKPLGDYDQK